MSPIISFLYVLLVVIFLVMGASIVFHMLYYRINRRAARAMFIIYATGAVIFLISNFIFFKSVDWYQIFSNINL
jgi:hypothetical protein